MVADGPPLAQSSDRAGMGGRACGWRAGWRCPREEGARKVAARGVGAGGVVDKASSLRWRRVPDLICVVVEQAIGKIRSYR